MAKAFWNAEPEAVPTPPLATYRRCKIFQEKTPAGLESAIGAWLATPEVTEVISTQMVPWRDNSVMCLVFYTATI